MNERKLHATTIEKLAASRLRQRSTNVPEKAANIAESPQRRERDASGRGHIPSAWPKPPSEDNEELPCTD